MISINKIHFGDCLKNFPKIPNKSIDLIFLDPPYNLQLNKELTRPNHSVVKGVDQEWDKFDNFNSYDQFSKEYLSECKRVLKDDGTIWISGTLHNHPIIGVTLKKLGLWIINDIVWFKPNATPLLQTTRLAPSIELIWLASKSKKYYFDYALAKEINGGKQMRNMWQMAAQRHKTKHPTEKPEPLLERIISIGSQKNAVVLDPFMGSGTTGVIAKKLGRSFIGIEMDKTYYEEAKLRIKNTKKSSESPELIYT